MIAEIYLLRCIDVSINDKITTCNKLRVVLSEIRNVVLIEMIVIKDRWYN